MSDEPRHTCNNCRHWAGKSGDDYAQCWQRGVRSWYADDCADWSPAPLTAAKIIEDYLRANGFDGLAAPDQECGCQLCDLMPCGSNFGECLPGYKAPHQYPEEADWAIYPSRAAAEAAKRKAQQPPEEHHE